MVTKHLHSTMRSKDAEALMVVQLFGPRGTGI